MATPYLHPDKHIELGKLASKQRAVRASARKRKSKKPVNTQPGHLLLKSLAYQLGAAYARNQKRGS